MGVTYTHPQGTPNNGAKRAVYGGGYIQVGSTYKPGDTTTTGLYVVGGTYGSWGYDGATVTIYSSGSSEVSMYGGEPNTAGDQRAYYYFNGGGGGSWSGGMGGYVSWVYNAPGAPYFTSVSRNSAGTSLYVAVAGGSGRVTYHNVIIDGAGWSGNGTTFSTNAHQSYNVYGRAGNEDNVSASAYWGVSHGIPNAPGKPSVSANASVAGRIDVSWTAPSYVGAGIAEYHVYRDGAFIASTTSTSYADTGRTVGTSYSYTVYARNSTGWGPVSDTSNSVTATGVPNAPTSLSVTASTDTFGKVSLSWTAPTIATGGVVDYFIYADGVLKASSTTTSGVITGLNERQTYTFTVRARNQFAINNNTLGAESSGVSRKSPAPPSAPLSLQSSAPFVPAGTINLTWDPPADDGDEFAGITGYNIYLAGQSSPFDTIDGTDTEYTATGLVPATSYTFTVRARNAIADTVGTYSVDSNTTTAQAQGEPEAPTGLTVTADPVVAGKLILTWTPPVGYITGFRVYNATTNAEIANVVTPRLELEGLNQNQSYSYKVRARNPVTDSLGSDGGPFSSIVSGTPSGTSTQTVPSITVANTTNATFVGTFPLVSTTATTMTYAKTASNIASASVPLSAGSTTNETNLLVNGDYSIDIPTAKTVRYAKSGVVIAANTGTPSGTMTNRTNIKFTGPEGTGTFAVSGTDPLTNKVSYLKTESNVTSVAATGSISNESNEIYNGQYTLTGVTETTMTFDKTASDIPQTLAYGSVFNKTNQNIFNGTFNVIETPDYQTFTYNTGDLTYAENLITNPSFETVQSGTTTLRTNLVTNPSFETNVTGWSTSSSTIARNSAFSHYGTYSGLVSPATNSGGVTTSVTTTSGLAYTVSMWVYATSATSVQMTVDSPATTGAATAIPADTWTRVSLSFTANTTTTAVGVKTYGSTQPFYIDGVLVEQTSELRPYFSGATTDALGWDYGWSGTANASTSTAKALTTAQRTNLIPNPSFQNDLTSWSISGYGATGTISTSESYVGTKSAYITAGMMGGEVHTGSPGNIPVTVGTQYTASAWVKRTPGVQTFISVGQFNSSNGSVASNLVTLTHTTSDWERVSVTVTIQATTVNARVSVGLNTSNGTGYVDAVQFEVGSSASSYFDGSFAGASWAGTAHASASTTGGTNALPVGLTEVSSGIVSTYARSHSGSLSALVFPSSNTGGASLTQTTVAGTVYTFSAWVYSDSAKNMKLSADSTVGTTVAVPANTWTRLSLSFTAEDTSTLLSIVGTDSTTAFYLDDVMLQESSALQDYFDGDTDATTTTWPVVYSWAGTPHASISSREVGETLPTVGSDILLPYGDASRGESQASLEIRYRSGWLG